MNIVAEGIETGEQLEFLRQSNCSEGQGYFISIPRATNEIEQYLSANAFESTAA
jgi:EAL domain-containing protein (putative c-di-GMP-specific phosphodiesterase class I)